MGEVVIREAAEGDLAAIVSLLLNDSLGKARESGKGSEEAYAKAFSDITADPRNFVLVAEDGGEIVGTFQITFITNLSFEGGTRALIEAVRVADSHQGTGLGRRLMEHGIEMARERGCRIVQLTSNKTRAGAIKFYEKIGFEATHEGFKLYL